MLRRDHLMSLSQKGRDQFAGARAVGPEAVNEDDAGFALVCHSLALFVSLRENCQSPPGGVLTIAYAGLRSGRGLHCDDSSGCRFCVADQKNLGWRNEILEFDCHVRFPQIAEVVRSLRIDRPSARLRGSVFGPPDTGLRSGFPWAIRRK